MIIIAFLKILKFYKQTYPYIKSKKLDVNASGEQIYLRHTVGLHFSEQVKAMPYGHCWLACQQSDPHDGESDPSQPVLASLAIGIEESPNDL